MRVASGAPLAWGTLVLLLVVSVAVAMSPARQDSLSVASAPGEAAQQPSSSSAAASPRATAEEWEEFMSLLQRFEHLNHERNSPHEMAFFQQDMTEDSTCGAIMQETCDPCYNHPKPLPNCGNWKATCHKLFCAPLCLRLLWTVEATASGGSDEFQQEFEDPAVKGALEAYLMAYGCNDILGCCPKGDMLDNWTEQRVYQGMYPKPGAIPSCAAEKDREKAKASCAVSVQVKSIPDACEKFVLPERTESHAEAMAAFARAKLPGAQQNPKHLSFRERCEKLQKAIEGQASDMQTKFEEAACGCLGCDSWKKCPHAVVYDTLPAALKDFKSYQMNYAETDSEAEGEGEGEAEGGDEGGDDAEAE